MNKLRVDPILKGLNNVSDGLIDNNSKLYLDFDEVCRLDTKTKEFKMVDTLLIFKDEIYLIEFKKCNWFYTEISKLEHDARVSSERIMTSIIEDAPQKLTDTILVQLPKFIKNFSIDTKINYIFVLGTKETKGNEVGRNRAIKNSSSLEKLKNSIIRYKGTHFVKDVLVQSKEEFLNSSLYKNNKTSWSKVV